MYFYTNTLKDLDFRFFELLLVSIFSIKTLNFKLYSHQKLAIFFNSTLCLTKIAPIILSFRDGNSKEYLWYTEDAFWNNNLFLSYINKILCKYSNKSLYRSKICINHKIINLFVLFIFLYG